MLFNIVSLSMRFGDYDYDIVTRQVVETMAQVLFLTFALYSVSSKFESVSSKFGEPGETRIFYGLGATAYVLAISKFLLVMNGNVSFTTEVVGALNTIAQLIPCFRWGRSAGFREWSRTGTIPTSITRRQRNACSRSRKNQSLRSLWRRTWSTSRAVI